MENNLTVDIRSGTLDRPTDRQDEDVSVNCVCWLPVKSHRQSAQRSGNVVMKRIPVTCRNVPVVTRNGTSTVMSCRSFRGT